MRAWQCKAYNFATAHGHIGKDVNCVDQLPIPQPGPGQVLVQVHYAAVDPIDAKVLAGVHRKRFPICTFPFVPGLDAAGKVVGLGPDCEGELELGDAVALCVGLQESCRRGACFGPAGALAEYCVCPESQVSKVPEGLDLMHFAGLPYAGLTAYQALFTGNGASTTGEPLGQVGEGDKVLILGGNRGPGHLAVQMARMAGATVATTVPETCLDWMVSLGANHVISYRSEDWVETLKGQDFDLVLDCVGWATSVLEMDRASEVLHPQGLYITISEFDAFEGLGARYSCQFKAMVPKAEAEDLDILVDWVSSRKLQVSVDLTCSFKDARHALHRSLVGRARGKVVVSCLQQASEALGGA